MGSDFSRRKFLESIAIGGAASASLPLWTNLAAAKEPAMPHRTLGHTRELLHHDHREQLYFLDRPPEGLR
jgi:hypothetical protein